jgi:hypothetical protein
MPEIVFAVPVLAGKEQLDRETLDEMAESRSDEYEAVLKEAGVTRHAVWHEQTPDGTLALVYIEADTPDAAERLTTSDAPISRFFIERMHEVHGIDISHQPPPPVSKVHDFRVQP